MELFFFVSGSVFHCSKYYPYILNKVDRLVVPMFFVGMIALLFHSFGGAAVNEHMTISEGLRGLVTGESYWFLYTLFLIFAIYPLIDRIGRKWHWFEPALFVCLIVLGHFVKYPPAFRINSVMYYLPYFMMGHILSAGLKQHRFALPTGKTVAVLGGAVAGYVALRLFLPREVSLVRYAAAFAMIAAFFYLAQLFLRWYDRGDKVSSVIYDFICLASRYSLQLYLFNGFILVAARTILVSRLHLTNPVLVIPLIVAANLAVTLPVCKYVLEKTRWIGWLCGVKYRPWKK